MVKSNSQIRIEMRTAEEENVCGYLSNPYTKEFTDREQNVLSVYNFMKR